MGSGVLLALLPPDRERSMSYFGYLLFRTFQVKILAVVIVYMTND